MIEALENTGLQLCSLVKLSGELELSLRREAIPTPGDDEVVIRVQAAPINPSDLGLLFGPADLTTVRESGTQGEPVLTAGFPRPRWPIWLAASAKPCRSAMKVRES